jgi:hypothetical protein
MTNEENTTIKNDLIEEFTNCLEVGDIDKAYEIIFELQDLGFPQDSVELEDRYDEFMRLNASPQYHKTKKEEDEANNGYPSDY